MFYKVLQLITSTFYSVLLYNSKITFPPKTQNQSKCCYQPQQNSNPPKQYMYYKLSILLYKLKNFKEQTQDWTSVNFMQALT